MKMNECGISAIILRRIETYWLDEWIEYHLSIGFTKVLLYDNGNTSVDNSDIAKGGRALTKEEESRGVWIKKPDAEYFWDKTDEDIEAELERLKGKYRNSLIVEPWVMGQNHLFEYPESQTESLKFTISTYPFMRWAFIDPDEFLILPRHNSIQELTAEYTNIGCLKFSERVYEERKRGKKALDITKWAYESPQGKYLVRLPVVQSESFNVHNAIPVEGGVIEVPSSTAYIKHCRGNPMKHGGELNRKTYEMKGSPEFKSHEVYATKNKNLATYTEGDKDQSLFLIHTFIFTWKGYFEKAVELEHKLKKFSKVTVINSDDQHTCNHWITLTNEDYFSGQMKRAIGLFDGEIMAHIQADCSYDKWKEVYENAKEQLLRRHNGIYAPNLNYTPLKGSVVDVRKTKDKTLSYVSFTDETAWFISGEVIKKFKPYEYLFRNNKYGYGWDLIMASVSWANSYPVIRDYNHTVSHPQGKGYSDREAMAEMGEMIKKAPTELAKVVYDIKNDRKNLFSKYILRDADKRKYTKKMAVVLVATKRELENGDVRKCLDNYFKTEKGTFKIDLKIYFNIGDEQEYQDLKRYEMYPSVNKVTIKSHRLSSIDDLYIRTPEQAKNRNVIPKLGASAGANNLFFDTMIPLMEDKYEYYLMIETDSRPLIQEWIEGIMKYADKESFLIAGSHYKGTQELTEYESWTGHLNGIAIYKKSKKLQWLLRKTKRFIAYQVVHKNEIFLSFDVAMHLYISTIKGLKYFRNIKTPWNKLMDTPIITNMSLPCDKEIDTNEVVDKYPATIILHQKYK